MAGNGTPHLLQADIIDSLDVRDHLAVTIARIPAAVGLTDDGSKKIAERLIRQGYINVRAVEADYLEARQAFLARAEEADR